MARESQIDILAAVFALNEVYFLTEKGVLNVISSFKIKPTGYAMKINWILGNPGCTSEGLLRSVHELTLLWKSVLK